MRDLLITTENTGEYRDHFRVLCGKRFATEAEAWSDEQIVQQAVAQLPWGHNLVLLTKLKNREERLVYAQKVPEQGWSRNVLLMQFESNLLERQGQAITNFDQRLPKPQSDLARESLTQGPTDGHRRVQGICES